jgi:putative ABC transport system permease protein
MSPDGRDSGEGKSDRSVLVRDNDPPGDSQFARIGGILRLATSQLWQAKLRTTLAVIGVAVAVVLVVLMAGLGYGMTQAGTEALTYIDQDLWATAGPLQLAPGTVGGVENTLVDAHERRAEIEEHPNVRNAEALAFQSVYISSDRDDFDTVVGVGVTGNGTGVGLSGDFEKGDTHYANGTYDGPLTQSVVLNNELASQLNVTTGDTVYIGGTLGGARQNEYTVVAVDRRFSVFLGAPTAVVHLSELQTMTGSAGSDRASMIGIRLESGTDPQAVATDLERQHPDLSVRTQQEQFRSVFENQGPVLASAITLVSLAVAIGVGLVGNTLGMVVYQQRRELAALRAVGLRLRLLLAMVILQALVVASIGVTLGVVVAVPAADLINEVVNGIVGFPNLIKLIPSVLAAGVGIGLCIGLLGAALAGWRLTVTNPKEQLSS